MVATPYHRPPKVGAKPFAQCRLGTSADSFVFVLQPRCCSRNQFRAVRCFGNVTWNSFEMFCDVRVATCHQTHKQRNTCCTNHVLYMYKQIHVVQVRCVIHKSLHTDSCRYSACTVVLHSQIHVYTANAPVRCVIHVDSCM